MKKVIIATTMGLLMVTMSVAAGVYYQKYTIEAANRQELKVKEENASRAKQENDRKKQEKLEELQRESDRLGREIIKREVDLERELAAMRIKAALPKPPKPAKNDIEVYEIYTKSYKRDAIGNIWVSLKVTAKNNGHTDKVFIRIQAIDYEGFAIEDKLISGSIPHGTTKILTDTTPIDEVQFRKIAKWKVSE